MRAIKYKELKRMYEALGPAKAVAHLREALQTKDLAPQDFSLRELAEATAGAEWVKRMDPRAESVAILEAGEAVDVTAFSNITGQIVYSRIMDAYQNPAFWASSAVETISTRLDGEKIAGMDRLKESDAKLITEPGMPYQALGFGEDYVETPATTKRGLIVPVTKEAIFFDRTNLVLSRAAEVGEVLGTNKEKRLLDLVLGTVNNYKWKGTSYDTYVSTPWDNTITNELVDWTDIDAAEQLFSAMTDPATGEPILIDYTQASLIVMPAYRHAARRIVGATELKYGADSGTIQTMSPNTLSPYKIQDNTALAKARLVASGVSASDASKYWYFGQVNKAFAYMENWPITVVQAPTNSEAEFTQDIVLRWKASERGVAAVMNPRFMVQSTGAA